jgi:hypothetical protein
MRRFFVSLLLAGSVLIPSAAAADPPAGTAEDVPEVAFLACGDAIGSQIDLGVEAGGGPKEGFLAPTNCDWFFFFIDAIGQHPAEH